MRQIQMNAREKAYTGKLMIICLCLGVLSAFLIPRIPPATQVKAMVDHSLSESREDVAIMLASAAGASVALAAIPDDSTTPVADQIANVCSYLMIVVGAITIEKYVFALCDSFIFQIMIPVALLFLMIYFICRKIRIKIFAMKLLKISLLLYFLVPVSLLFGNYLSDTFEIRKGIRELQSASESIQEEADSEDDGGILDAISGLGDKIINTVTGSLDKMKQLLNRFVDAVITMIIVNCVIPIFTLWLMLKIVNAEFFVNKMVVPPIVRKCESDKSSPDSHQHDCICDHEEESGGQVP